MNKLIVIREIDEMLETYCDGCFIKRELKTNGGKAVAHRFCIDHCTVGEQLRFLGIELNKVKN
ncbi:zinc-finger domain-containing protein [Paenisporosarcina indica]|uniref:zinc-finger domain-containing protein n=1 Tax=Paenisporosarcina indica TaxID=650093 RepID=UPI00094F650D|nr:zinc-finger domain-containing protein [Paenisporosarcina indica]